MRQKHFSNQYDEKRQSVIPGFEYLDHDFMLAATLRELVTDEQARELTWLLKGE